MYKEAKDELQVMERLAKHLDSLVSNKKLEGLLVYVQSLDTDGSTVYAVGHIEVPTLISKLQTANKNQFN